MLATLLAVSLLGLDARNLHPVAQDRYFAWTIEDWTYRAQPRPDFPPGVPTEYRRWISCLGCGHYDCRLLAAATLQQAGPRALRPLVWGSYDPDPEIARQCEDLLDRYVICVHCLGSGFCLTDRQNSWPGCPYCYQIHLITQDSLRHHDYFDRVCLGCWGTGSARNQHRPLPTYRR